MTTYSAHFNQISPGPFSEIDTAVGTLTYNIDATLLGTATLDLTYSVVSSFFGDSSGHGSDTEAVFPSDTGTNFVISSTSEFFSFGSAGLLSGELVISIPDAAGLVIPLTLTETSSSPPPPPPPPPPPAVGPTPLTVATLDSAVYDQPLHAIPGWTMLNSLTDGDFQAAAYVSSDGSQIVIAIRGTALVEGSIYQGFQNVLTDVGTFGTGVPTLGMRQLVLDGSNFLAETMLKALEQYPDAQITLSGHSLGGAVAQLLAMASGFDAVTVNAPGAKDLYPNLQTELAGALALKPLNPTQPVNSDGQITNILNIRNPGDVVSLIGPQIGITETIAPTPGSSPSWWNAIGNHMVDTGIIPALQSGSTLEPGIDPVASGISAAFSTAVPFTPINARFGAAIANDVLNVAPSLLVIHDPPSGAEIIYSQTNNSPPLSSVTFADDPDIAQYRVEAEVGGSWSAPQLVSAGIALQLPSGATGFAFQALSSDGQIVPLPEGYLFGIGYTTTGVVSDTIAAIVPFASSGTVSSGQVASSVLLVNSGALFVYGVSDVATISSGGSLDLEMGGTASGTTISEGGVVTVHSGGIAYVTTVDDGGILDVFAGGTASGTVVSSGGREIVWGGTASGTTVSSGGVQVVLSGGTVRGTTVDSGGALTLDGGALLSGTTTISAGGELEIDSGYILRNYVVSSGVALVVNSLGTASGAVVSSGGALSLLGGALLSGTTTISAGGVLGIGSGYTLSNYTVSSGVSLVVGSGGVTIGAIVSSGGIEISDGIASSTSVKAGGTLELLGDAQLSGVTISAGGTLAIGSGYTLGNYVVSSGTTLLVGAGLSFNGQTIISAGGVVSGATISGGTLALASGGALVGSVAFSGVNGTLRISGASVPTNIISGFAAGDTIDLAGVGFAGGGSATLLSGNVLQVVENGHTYVLNFASSPSFNGQQFSLSSDGAGGTNVTLSGTPASSGQTLNVLSGQTSHGVTLTSGKTLNVLFGGIASATVDSGGNQIVFGSAVDGVFIHGNEVVRSGGVTTNTTISSGVSAERFVRRCRVGHPDLRGGSAERRRRRLGSRHAGVGWRGGQPWHRARHAHLRRRPGASVVWRLRWWNDNW